MSGNFFYNAEHMSTSYAPCPKCNAVGAQKMSFTWWGGVLGPKLLTHVKCPQCSHAYNGKTGKDNTTNIIIYSVVLAVIAFGIMFVLFAGLGILSVMSK